MRTGAHTHTHAQDYLYKPKGNGDFKIIHLFFLSMYVAKLELLVSKG